MGHNRYANGRFRVGLLAVIAATTAAIFNLGMGTLSAADERGIAAIKKHLARPESFLLETEFPGVDMGTYTFSRITSTVMRRWGVGSGRSPGLRLLAQGGGDAVEVFAG